MDYKQTVIEFVEGSLAYNEFHSLVLNDDAFAQWIDENVPADWRCYTRATQANNYTVEELPYSIRHSLQENAWEETEGSVGYKVNLYSSMKLFLQKQFPDLVIKPDTAIYELNDLVLGTCPAYIDGTEVWASGLIEKIAMECPDDWSKVKKAKHIKTRIIEEFHVQDKKYPKWIQNPEWPFANGRPMKFVKTTVKYKNEWYQHHFVDVDTGEERIIDDMH